MILQVIFVVFGLFEDDKLIEENEIDNGKTHSENFMLLVKKTLEKAKMNLVDIDVISVVVGPGSFTGIRIGVASVKAMAEVCGLKLVSVYSLEVLAANEYGKGKNICSLIDAKNNQVYCGIFNDKLDKLEEFLADDIDNCLEILKKYDNIIFVGNGSELHFDKIKGCFRDKEIDFSINNKQNAKSLGIITNKKINKGEFLTSDTVVPVYLRKSQAERLKSEKKV